MIHFVQSVKVIPNLKLHCLPKIPCREEFWCDLDSNVDSLSDNFHIHFGKRMFKRTKVLDINLFNN